MAYPYARFAALPHAERIVEAMRAHPGLVGAEDGADVQLMRTVPGAIAKGGAVGLLCAAIAGVGIVLKCDDGASRPLAPALAAFLAPLGYPLPDLEIVPVTNSRGEHVGDLRVVHS
jgi:L-asparaginase II